MSAPKDWWSDLNSTRPGPARIRVTFNRDFTPAEQEHFRAFGKLTYARLRHKFRISPDGRLYVEADNHDSRQLFDAVAAMVSASFVNVFPTAVRTFRERVVGPTPKGYATGGVVHSGGVTSTVASTMLDYNTTIAPGIYNTAVETRAQEVVRDELAKLNKKKGKKK